MEASRGFIGCVTIKNRELLEIDGIDSVSAFDESFVALNCSSGVITVEGEDMKIEDLSKEKGNVRIVGKINGVAFEVSGRRRGPFGLFS